MTISGELCRQLTDAHERIEFRDAHGKLLGLFEPGISEADIRLYEQLTKDGYPYGFAEFRQGLQEVRRAIQDPGYARDWKTTDQLMALLKTMP